MNLGLLRLASRQLINDDAGAMLVQDEELDRYCNNAVAEAAIRTRLLKDDDGPATRIPLVVGQARYALDPDVLGVLAAHVTGRMEPLIRTTAPRLDGLEPGWSHQTRPTGSPRYAVLNLGQKSVTLFPAPAFADTLHLRVWRVPSEAELMEEEDDEPALILPRPEALKHWVAFEVYSKKDGELDDNQRAKDQLALFEAAFGPRPTAHQLTLWSTSPITGPRARVVDF